ncbi:MAG: hypothetical protein FJ145_21520 [Deltaproteobacteria bacterium]|nr:hypothetical protein [Deltaproteobacteria bacterium]
MKTATGQIAKASLPEREILQQLLLFNLFLQIVDGVFTYSRHTMATFGPLSWSTVASVLYHKSLACLLLVLIVWLGKRKPELAAKALVITGTIYTVFAIYSIHDLIG